MQGPLDKSKGDEQQRAQHLAGASTGDIKGADSRMAGLVVGLISKIADHGDHLSKKPDAGGVGPQHMAGGQDKAKAETDSRMKEFKDHSHAQQQFLDQAQQLRDQQQASVGKNISALQAKQRTDQASAEHLREQRSLPGARCVLPRRPSKAYDAVMRIRGVIPLAAMSAILLVLPRVARASRVHGYAYVIAVSSYQTGPEQGWRCRLMARLPRKALDQPPSGAPSGLLRDATEVTDSMYDPNSQCHDVLHTWVPASFDPADPSRADLSLPDPPLTVGLIIQALFGLAFLVVGVWAIWKTYKKKRARAA